MAKLENNPLMTLAEVALYLKIAEKTVLRLVHKGVLPGTKVGNQWRFFKSIIDDWLLTNICKTTETKLEQKTGNLLSTMLESRYILPDITPGKKEHILQQLIAPLVQQRIIRAPVLTIQKLMYRENISSTGIGNEVAFPHFRNPRENPAGAPPIIVGICKNGVDYNAIDQKPVKLFFLLCSDQEASHLSHLSKLGHLLLDNTLRKALIQARTREEFIAIIREKECKQSNPESTITKGDDG